MTVLREFRVCEFTTLSRDGTPTTWPTAARYEPENGRFLITTSIGFPQKVYNIRRNPRVSLLFSDPTASKLVSPAAVLVQGDASVSDSIVTSMAGLEDYWRENIFSRQPASEVISSNPMMRRMMDWYYMRLVIFVQTCRISWWPAGDFHQPARVLEVNLWDKLLKNLAAFPSAVLTGLDADGYPFSVRVKPQPDSTRQVLHVQLPPEMPIRPGGAAVPLSR